MNKTYQIYIIHSSAGERVSPVLGRVLTRMLLGLSLAIEMQRIYCGAKCLEIRVARIVGYEGINEGNRCRNSMQVFNHGTSHNI